MAAPTRRTLLKRAALATAALAAPRVRGAYAAGRLAVAAWDHPVPEAGKALGQICADWAKEEKVELTFDLVTSRGGKDVATLQAEGRAKAGHDVIGVRLWNVAAWKDAFVPVDDLVAPLVAEAGPVAPGCEYLAKIDGHWRAVPSGYGSFASPCWGRIDYLNTLAGIDAQKMYPGPGGTADPALQDAWTWDNFLAAADKCAKGGHVFALPLSACTDAADMIGAVFAAHGAALVDKDGAVTVKTDATRQALEWFKKLAATLPDTVYAFDNAANGKALVSGQSALILDPPSAYAAARRTAPAVAAQLWSFPAPKGPVGRFDPAQFSFWSIWNFSANIAAAKALLAHLATREVQQKLAAASGGFDIPPFAGWLDFPVWQQAGPPTGALYNYPPRGDAVAHVSGQPAPPKIAAPLYAEGVLAKMIALHTRDGKSPDEAMGWAQAQIEGFTRS